MRSLGTVRARVERLAAVCLPSEAEPADHPLAGFRHQRCPACGARPGGPTPAARVRGGGLTAARARRRPGPECSIGPNP